MILIWVFRGWAFFSSPAGPGGVRWGVSDSGPVGLADGGHGVAGGPIAAVNSRCHAVAQGQRVGSRRVSRRAERVTRAARVIR